MSVTIGGTFSGLNVSSIISAIIAADSIPITNLQKTDTDLQTQSTTLGGLGTSLGQLSTVLQSLTPNVLASQSATGSDPSVGTATVDSTAQSGSVSVNVTQLASNTVMRSGSGTNTKLAAAPAGNTNIGTVLDESAVDGQTFTINGKTITLASTDVLDDGNANSTASVIGKINNSGAGVTATYDATTGKISLASASPILLGQATDTSDFLQQAQLFNNASGAVTSEIGIGRIDPNADLATAGLATAPTAGTFTVNGVSINYNAGDSLDTVINNINLSGAGVTAIYDTYEDQLVLTSTTRGPQNITIADGSSNAATALRLTSRRQHAAGRQRDALHRQRQLHRPPEQQQCHQRERSRRQGPHLHRHRHRIDPTHRRAGCHQHRCDPQLVRHAVQHHAAAHQHRHGREHDAHDDD